MNPFLYFLVFFKASLFSTGGLGNLPSVHQDMLEMGWAQEADFGKAIAVGQITPGPNGLWVIALGYLTYGFLGAFLALAAILIPPFLVLALAAVYNKIENRRAVRAIMRGLALAVVGSILVVSVSLVTAPGIDWRGYLFALAAFALGITERIHVAFILALAAFAGLFVF